ncbi:MAG: DUF6350 family protein [Gordonia sp. (in: high G+C Gram-positive bacteria)]
MSTLHAPVRGTRSARRTTTGADSLAARLRAGRRARRAQHDDGDRNPRALIVIAFGVPLLAVFTTAIVVTITLLLAGSPLTGVGAATAAGWLAIHHVPLTITGVTLGVLPLLPTLVVFGATVVGVARAAAERHGRTELGVLAGAAICGPVLVSAVALALVMDGGSVLPIQSPDPLAAFGNTVLVHGLAAAVGIVVGNRDVLARLTPTDRRGLRQGVIGALALCCAGALLIVLRFVLCFGQVGALLSQGYDADGYLGLTVLSVLYLPNLVIGATAVLVGSQAHVGAVSVDLFGVQPGSVPPLPILAVLPDHAASGAPIGLLVPAAIAAFVAWRCRTADLLAYLRTVGLAGAVAAALIVIGGRVAGGTLGQLGDASITAPTAGIFTVAWIVGAALIVRVAAIALPGIRPGGAPSADWLDDVDEDNYDDDYVEEDFEDFGYLDPDDLDPDDLDPDGAGAEDLGAEVSGTDDELGTDDDHGGEIEDEWAAVGDPGPVDESDPVPEPAAVSAGYPADPDDPDLPADPVGPDGPLDAAEET